MARFTIGCVASLTVLLVAGASPLSAEEEVGTATLSDCPCPPGPPPSYLYPPPPSRRSLPAPSEQEMAPIPAPRDSDKLPDAPPSPGEPSDTDQPSDAQQPSDTQQPDSQQPFDMQQPDSPQTPDFNTQPPDMTTPTFNPSAMPTTAATSAQTTAPNMIGDLFGTSFGGGVPVVIDNFFGRIGDGSAIPGEPFDPTSTVSYSTDLFPGSPDDLDILRSPSGPVLTTVSIPSPSMTTADSQLEIATDDPSLTTPVQIVNNSSVQGAVDTFAESIHGTGEAVFVPEASVAELNPSGGIATVTPEALWNYDFIVFSEVGGISNLGAAPGAMVGRQKLTENSSPIPQDRVFVNYSYFRNTPLQSDGLDVHRVTPGFEKTFFRGNASIEVRAPFASTLDSDVLTGGLTDTDTAEFGNLTVYFKALLWDAGYEALSAGFGLTFPTADDVVVRTADGTPLLDVENESVHFLPFIAGLYMPTERFFFQGMVQLDIDPEGNPVRFSEFNNGIPTGNLRPAGRPNDADYVFLDFNVGYWIYRAPVPGVCCCEQCASGGYGHGWIRGIAPIFELHYNGTFDEAENVIAQRGSSTVRIGDGSRSDIDLWNVVLGTTIQFRDNATLTLGYAAPLNDTEDEQFDSEFRAVFNWYFGGPGRGHSCRLCRF